MALHRLGGDDTNRRVMHFQAAANPGERTSRTKPGYQNINIRHIRHNLRARRLIVSFGVCLVAILKEHDVARILLYQFLRQLDCTVAASSAGGCDDVGPIEFKQPALVLCALLGDDGGERIALHAGHQRQRYAGVAAGRLQHYRVSFQQTSRLGLLDHLQCDTILDAPGRIRALHFGEDLHSRARAEAFQFDQGSMTDGLQNVIIIHTVILLAAFGGLSVRVWVWGRTAAAPTPHPDQLRSAPGAEPSGEERAGRVTRSEQISAGTHNFIDYAVNVAFCGHVVDNACPQHFFPLEAIAGEKHSAAPLHLKSKLSIEAVKLLRIISERRRYGAETHDTERSGGNEFEVGRSLYKMGQQASHVNVMSDGTGQPRAPGRAHDGPDLKRAEAARALQGIIRYPGFVIVRFFRPHTKGASERSAVPHERAATVNRHGEPLVLVGCQRVHTFDTFVMPGYTLIQNAEGAIGAINVQPETLLVAEIGQFVERVDGPRIYRARACRHTEGAQSSRAILLDAAREPVNIHLKGGRGGNDVNGFASQPHRLYRLANAEMALVRLVEHKGRMIPLQALLANIPAIHLSGPVARGLQTGEIGLGAAADENARAPLYRKVAQFHDPLHHAPL